MTLAQFKILLQPGAILDSPFRQVTLNFDLVGSSNKISVVAVRITATNLQQLQNATRISLTIPNAGTSISIPLQTSLQPLRTINREQVGNYYLYSIVEVDQQPTIAAPILSGTPPAEYYATEVLIEPTIASSGLKGSEYDALLNDASSDRQSNYIQISDRGQNSPFPRNINSLLNNTAIRASIQDSNYSNTPWISSRYEGAKTDAIGYGGVEPAIIGGSFAGALFPQTYTEPQIRALSLLGITYEDYFFTGKLDAPTCTLLPIGTLSDTITAAQTTFRLTVGSSAVKLQPGDLLFITNTSFPIFGQEVVKLLAVRSIIDGPINYSLDVLRGFGGTKTADYDYSANAVYLIASNQVYTLKNNRAQPLLGGKLLVRDSKELLYINTAGYSTSGSRG